MPEIVTPPDLQTAGAAQPPQDAQSLVGMLRSGGSPPSGLMEAMRMPQMTPETMFASAVTGGLNPSGPNPVQQQLQQQQQAQMQQAQLIEKVQTQRRKEALAKDQAAFDVLGTIIKDPNTSADTLKALWPQYQKKSKDFLGIQLPDSMATRVLTPKDIDEIRKRTLLGDDDASILSAYPKSTSEDLKRIRSLPKTQRVYDYLGLDSDEKIAKEALDLQIKGAQAAEALAPELKGDPKTSQRAMILHQQKFGKPFLEGSAATRAQALREAVLAQRQEHIQDFVTMETLREQLREKFALAQQGRKTIAEGTAIFVDKAGNQPPSNLTEKQAAQAGYFKITPRELDSLNQSQQAFQILQNFKDTVDKMKSAKLFVTRGGLPGVYEQMDIAAKKQFGDPETSKKLLRNFESQKSQLIILMRALGDKGVRALGAFAPMLEAVDPSAGSGSIESIMGQMESEIRALGTKSRTPEAYTGMPTIFRNPGETPKPSPGFEQAFPAKR